MLKKAEIQASSFDKLRMRWSDFNGLNLMCGWLPMLQGFF